MQKTPVTENVGQIQLLRSKIFMYRNIENEDGYCYPPSERATMTCILEGTHYVPGDKVELIIEDFGSNISNLSKSNLSKRKIGSRATVIECNCGNLTIHIEWDKDKECCVYHQDSFKRI